MERKVIKKRLIFTLLLDDGIFQLSRNFSKQKVGDLHWLFNSYHAESILHSIDELVVLNVSRNNNTFDSFVNVLKELSEYCFMPIAAGGGIRTIEQARQIFHAGADKIVLNSTLFTDQDLVNQISEVYGKQNIVASIDYRLLEGELAVYIECGQKRIEQSFEGIFRYLAALPVGEIYITSIDRDGTGRGYDLEVLNKIQYWVGVPIIASGGVGKFEHFHEGMKIERVTGVSSANLFNFIGDGLQRARQYLRDEKIEMASWDFSQLGVLTHEST